MSAWAKILDTMSDTMQAGEALTDGDLLYISTDGKVYKADANGSSTYPCVGAAGSTVAISDYVEVVIMGWRRDGSSLTIGGRQYLSNTAGAATQTAAGSEPQVVGWASSATDWFFFPYPIYNVPTA